MPTEKATTPGPSLRQIPKTCISISIEDGLPSMPSGPGCGPTEQHTLHEHHRAPKQSSRPQNGSGSDRCSCHLRSGCGFHLCFHFWLGLHQNLASGSSRRLSQPHELHGTVLSSVSFHNLISEELTPGLLLAILSADCAVCFPLVISEVFRGDWRWLTSQGDDSQPLDDGSNLEPFKWRRKFDEESMA